jgi:hypothetical protein
VDLSAGREAARLATEDERKVGVPDPTVLNRTGMELRLLFTRTYAAKPSDAASC